MYLVVGPQPENGDKLTAAESAWTDFVNCLGERVPITPRDGVDINTIDQWCGGIACSYRKGNTALIVLSKTFFGRAVSDERQTLLHETLHIKFLFADYMSARVGWLEKFVRQIMQQPPASHARLQRRVLALFLWQMPEEALVEQSVRTTYADFGPERAHGYVRNWIASDPRRTVEIAPFALRLYAILWEWLRAELALTLDLTDDDRATCARMRDELEACGSREYDGGWTALRMRARPLLDVSIEPLRIDLDLADSLRDEILAIRVD